MSTSIPAAIDALLATFTAAAPDGCTVIDGDPRDPGRKFLCVAWDESDNPVVIQTSAPSDMGMAGVREDFTVTNLLTVWAGDRTRSQVRADVFDLFATFSAAIAADHTLGDVVGQARISSLEYAPVVPTEGVLGQIRFTVSITAFTTE